MYNSMYNYSCGRMVRAVVKKWGNSFGIILPAELVKEKDIHINDVLEITIERKVRPISELFGTAKRGKKSTQEIKDELRKGWEEDGEDGNH